MTGGGVRHLRLAESEFYGVVDSGVSNLITQWSLKFAAAWQAAESKIYRLRSQEFMAAWQAAESEIYGERGQKFTKNMEI